MPRPKHARVFAKDYHPRPRLVAGTDAGATALMAVGARIGLRAVTKEGRLPC